MHIFYNGFMFSCLSRRQKESVNICSNLYEVKQQDIQQNFYKTAVRGGQQEKLMVLEQCGKQYLLHWEATVFRFPLYV